MKKAIVLIILLIILTGVGLFFYLEAKKPIKIIIGKEFKITSSRSAVLDKYKMKFDLLDTDPCLLEITFSEKDTYGKGPDTVQARTNYPEYAKSPIRAITLYRRAKKCSDDEYCPPHKPDQIIRLDDPGNPYSNYVCIPRYYEQCIQDGSFDCYYEEYCDYAPVKFKVGDNRDVHVLTINLLGIDNNSATFAITHNRRWREEREPGWRKE